MKQLLRSLIDFGGSVSQEFLSNNMDQIRASTYVFDRPDDAKIYAFVDAFFTASFECPSASTVAHHFEAETDIVERIKDIGSVDPRVRSNFAYVLNKAAEEQRKQVSVQLLKEGQEIIAKGLDLDDGEGKREGTREGLLYVIDKAGALLVENTKVRTGGDIRKDGPAMREEVRLAREDKSRAYGKFTGFNEIDKACKGAKRGELWVHGAFTGELKSTFALNVAYNLVTRYRTNVVYYSFEMPYAQVRRQVNTIHTTNPRWRAEGRTEGLKYSQIRDGELSPEDEDFFNRASEDFETNDEYCMFQIQCPDRAITIPEIQAELEALHRKNEIGFVVLDHGQLIEPSKGKRSKDYVVELNSVVHEARRLALHFNKGEGIPVMLLWQINRKGKDEADKNEGVYKMDALTYANEVEKSAALITTTYLNEDHRANQTTKICNLKNRDNKPFRPFDAGTRLESRLICSRERLHRPTNDNGMGIEEVMRAAGL